MSVLRKVITSRMSDRNGMDRGSCLLSLSLVLVVCCSAFGQGVIWQGGGGSSNWSEGANWSTGNPPTAGEVAVFDGSGVNGNKDCTLDQDATVSGLTANGFTGTIDCGSQNVSINGAILLNSGRFIATSASMNAGTFTHSGGTFDANGGTVYLSSTSNQNLTLLASTRFHNLVFSGSLVAYYALDDGTGSATATDASGNGNTGVLTNMNPAVDWVAGTTGTTFDSGGALSFNLNDTDDYLNIPNTILDGASDVTVSFWMRTSRTGSQAIISGANAGNNNEFLIFFVDDTTVNFYDGGSGSESYTIPSVADGNWHQFAFIRDDTNNRMKFVMDGVPRSNRSRTLSPLLIEPNGLVIGQEQDSVGGGFSTSQLFVGQLDDFRIYRQALDPLKIAEIGINGAAGVVGPTTTVAGADLAVDGNLTILSGTLDAGGFNISVGGSWLNRGGGFTPRTSTVSFSGSTTGELIASAGQLFNNVTIDGAGGAWTLEDQLQVVGSLSLRDGTLDVSSSNYDILTGSVDQQGGVFVARSGSVILTGPTDRTLRVSSALNDLRIEDSADNGLVAYYKFDEFIGTEVLDASGNGWTGRLTSVVSNSARTQRVADVPPSIRFRDTFSAWCDGNYDAVVLPSGVLDGATDVSISFWARSSNSGFQAIVSGANAGNNNEFLLAFSNSTTVIYYTGETSGTSVNWSGLSNLTDNAWHHFVFVRDDTNNQATLYLDGISQGVRSTTLSALSVDAGGLYLCVEQDRVGGDFADDQAFGGNLDDVRFYSRVLSVADVTDLASGVYPDGDNGTATYTLGAPLTLTGDLSIDAGILSAGTGGHGIGLAGDWYNGSGLAGFLGTTGTLTLTGGNQAVSGSTVFNNFIKTVTAPATITVEKGSTQTVTGQLQLEGAVGNLLSMRSSEDDGDGDPADRWFIDPQGTRTVRYVDVKDSENLHVSPVIALLSTDSGNNVNWIFSSLVTWTNGNNTGLWGDPLNWNPNGIPGFADFVVFTDAGSGGSLAGCTAAVGTVRQDLSRIELGAGYTGTVIFLANFAEGPSQTLNVMGDVVVNGGQLALSGDPLSGNGVTLNAATFTVGAGGAIQADGLGLLVGNGSHGGRGGDNVAPAYGSATSPVTLGQGAAGGPGGGAIFLNAPTGAIALDGIVRANGSDGAGDRGAGGSVYLSCDTLNGVGSIQTRGGTASDASFGGGGGRIAVDCNTLNFTGGTDASGGGGGAGTGERGSVTPGNLTVGEHIAGQVTAAFAATGPANGAPIFRFSLATAGNQDAPAFETMQVTRLVFDLSSVAGLTAADFSSLFVVADTNGNGDPTDDGGPIASIGTSLTLAGATGTVTLDFAPGAFPIDGTSATSQFILAADFVNIDFYDQLVVSLNVADASVVSSGTVLGRQPSTVHAANGLGFAELTGGASASFREIIPPLFANPQASSLLVTDGDTVTLTSNPAGGSGVYVGFQWVGSSGFTSSLQNPGPVKFPGPGLYTITMTVTDDRGQSDTDSLTIAVVASTFQAGAVATPDLVPLGGTFTLLAQPTGGTGIYVSYYWTGPNGFVSMLQDPGQFTASRPGVNTYTLTVTDASGLTVTQSVHVLVGEALPSLFVTNGGVRYRVSTASTLERPFDFVRIKVQGIDLGEGDRVAIDFNGVPIGDLSLLDGLTLDRRLRARGQLGAPPNVFHNCRVKYNTRRRRLVFVVARGVALRNGQPMVQAQSGVAAPVPIAVLIDRAPADGIPDTAAIVPVSFKVKVRSNSAGAMVESGKKIRR